MRRRAAFGLALIAPTAPVAAAADLFTLPLDCTIGETCVIEEYMDARPGPGVADYACGLKARDDHGGIDFALPSFEAMERGVAVLAAAPGRVRAVRDGVDDRPLAAGGEGALDGKDCGNAVRIAHEDGFETLYCHMRLGSVAVLPGQEVKRGARLGLVGLSGRTNYPHLHFTVLNGGAEVDPFAPAAEEGCDGAGAAADSLWQAPPIYSRTGLYTAGFSDAVPDLAEVRSGAARIAAAGREAPLVLYGYAFHPEAGDVLHFEAAGPGGPIFDTEMVLDDVQAEIFRAFGRRAPPGGWAPGAYRGYVRYHRDGRLLAVRHADVTVE
ncbi:M23 family metallopeptidase [Roseivivax sp. CAU 1761]